MTSPFLRTLRKRIVSNQPLLKSASQERRQRRCTPPLPVGTRGPFMQRTTEIWNFMYVGPHLAITSLQQHVLCVPQRRRSSTHSWEQQYDFKALEFGKQKCCLLLWIRGCGTVSHRCQALLVLLQKLILKGSKVPEASHYERLRRKSNSKPFSCFGYVKWKR